jgi:GTP-binding protein
MTEFCRLRKIFVSSGKGGKGSTHLHREKFIEKVDQMVVMEVVVDMFFRYKGLWTLFHLKFARHIKAGSGGDGSGDRSTGADGEDKLLKCH